MSKRPEPDYNIVLDEVSQLGYANYVSSTGKALKIYPVSSNVVRAIKYNVPQPEIPKIAMELVGGKTQLRRIKEGDEGWEDYQEELSAWNRGKNELQDAVALILALKDQKYPNPLEWPGDIQELVENDLLEIPKNPYLQRRMWLEVTGIIGQHDSLEIDWILQILAGVPEEVIQSMKDSFRNLLHGKRSEAVDGGSETDSGSD